MADNRNKTDQLHDLLPKVFGTKTNTNWNALVEAIGDSDTETAELIEEVRKQFFVKTAGRPYLDRLAANNKISRPRFVGMDDATLREYVPVLAYQPKQVKIVIDKLLDIFFFKESTTSWTQTEAYEPYALVDGWELVYQVDQYRDEIIKFSTANFTDIANATVDEVVAAINKQAKYSYAIAFDDSITQQKFVKIFTKTTGSKGAITMLGGRANLALQFTGYISTAGSGPSTEWTVTKVGDLVTFQHTAGTSPNIQAIKVGDYAMIQLDDNNGSFEIEQVNVTDNSFSFRNIFGTVGTYDHSLLPDTTVGFFRPEKSQVWKNDLRALSWEIQSGSIVVEMPASPPVVRRSLAGSAHLNGTTNLMTDLISETEMEIDDASDWPESGKFLLAPVNELIKRIKTVDDDFLETTQYNGRLEGFSSTYSYTGKTDNIITGITPNLPAAAALNEYNITGTSSRDASHIVTMTTSTSNDFSVGDTVIVADTVYSVETPIPFTDDPVDLMVPFDGTWKITEIVDDTTFKFFSMGDLGEATGGTVRVERPGLATSGSKIYLRSSRLETGILGPYVWDEDATFVLSSLTAEIVPEISAGNIVRSIEVNEGNTIPEEEGLVIFDFGTERQEGPVRYLYKPNDNTVAMDPAYVFRFNHDAGSSMTLIRNRGAHVMSGSAAEYPLYVTDPSVAREILQDLIQQVKSVGILYVTRNSFTAHSMFIEAE
jgi:hypothetical protein